MDIWKALLFIFIAAFVIQSYRLSLYKQDNELITFKNDNYEAQLTHETALRELSIASSKISELRAEKAIRFADSLRALKPIIRNYYHEKIIYALSLDDTATVKQFIANTHGTDSIN